MDELIKQLEHDKSIWDMQETVTYHQQLRK